MLMPIIIALPLPSPRLHPCVNAVSGKYSRKQSNLVIVQVGLQPKSQEVQELVIHTRLVLVTTVNMEAPPTKPIVRPAKGGKTTPITRGKTMQCTARTQPKFLEQVVLLRFPGIVRTFV